MTPAGTRMPLHHKLPLLTVVACTLAICLASMAYLVRDVVNFHRLQREQLTSLAHVIGKNSTAALSFQDQKVATRLLSALSVKQDILFAGTYDRNGRLFASYTRDGEAAPGQPENHLHAPGNKRRGIVCVTVPILMNQEELGQVHLCASSRTLLRAHIYRFLQFVAFVVCSLTLLAVLMARWMLSRFLRPLAALTRAADRVSQEQDYSVRVDVDNKQEIRELVTAFNMMLERIESSSAALKDSQSRLLKHHERLRSLSKSLQTAEERERHDLAVAVHDSVCQTLCGLQMELSALVGKGHSPSVSPSVGRLKSLVGTAIQEARSLTTRLFPRGLHDLGLGPALTGLAAEMEARAGLRIRVEMRGPEQSVDFDTRILAYRCVQELLRNIVKHSRAQTAGVDGEIDEQGLRIEVRDNGVGFDPERVTGEQRTEGGFGLFSIIERVHMAGGRVDIDSAPGRGSTITLYLPHHDSAASQEENKRRKDNESEEFASM